MWIGNENRMRNYRYLRNFVFESPDSIDADTNDIATRESKLLIGHDTGPCHQVNSLRKAIVSEEKSRQFVRLAFELRQSSAAIEDNVIFARNLKPDRSRVSWRLR
jgi:hypothetical protein